MVDLSRLMQDAATLEVIEKSAIEAQVLRHDVEAYRACLGYSVSGDHDGRLSDGTLPNNGIAEALDNECRTLSAQNSAQAMQIDELKRDLAAAQEWREAVLNELIVAHIYTKEHDTNPRKAIQDAITWSCQVALDPAVSSDARALIANELRAVAAAQEALKNHLHLDNHNAIVRQLEERAQRAEALAESYRTALVKVVAHTGMPLHPTYELLTGLIASIKRIANEAIDAAISEGK